MAMALRLLRVLPRFKVAFLAVALICSSAAADASASLRELLQATARGSGAALRSLVGHASKSILVARDEFGFCALAVAAYNGDVDTLQLLLNAGARVPPGELSVFMGPKGDAAAPVASVVELVVRRSSMLIMLGTGFQLPAYLREVQKKISTAVQPSAGNPDVPDMAKTLELLTLRGGARPTEKSLEEGADLARAAYFLDAGVVEVLVQVEALEKEKAVMDGGSRSKRSRGASRALIAAMLGIGQLKHRLNRALLSQPRMAGRMFRDYYGFSVGTEEDLTSPSLHSFSFQDTLGIVKEKAARIVASLLKGRADASFQQSRQSRKTPLHHCAEHGAAEIAELLLEARANPHARSSPLEQTPLHIAVVHRSTGVVRAMLAARADPLLRDGARRSALDLAEMHSWTEGQLLLGQTVAALAPAPGFHEAIAVPELLPAGSAWRDRWLRGDMAGREWSLRADDCEIDTVHTSELTVERFITDYLSVRRPLRIRDGAAHMPALDRWSSLRYLSRKAGGTMLRAVTIPYPEDFGDQDARDARQVTLKDYIDGVMGRVNSTSGTPLYVFSVVEPNMPEFKKLQSLVDKDAGPHPSWLIQNPKEKLKLRFGNTQFGLGPTGSGAPQHYHTHAYASLFSGQKRWWFFPPPHSSLSRRHALQFSQDDAAARRALQPADAAHAVMTREALPLVCDQVPGDVVYVPTDWGHLTLNSNISVSVSREFTWDGEETDSHVINSLML